MKLKEYIQTLNGNQLVKIGSQSGFVFIGTKDEWKKDEPKVNRNELDRFDNTIKEYSRKLRFLENRTTYSKLDEDRRLRDIQVYSKTVENARDKISKFVLFSDREINDIRKSGYEDAIIITVSGEEVSAYYTKNEYKGLSEKAAYKKFIRDRYKLDEEGKVVSTMFDLEENYESLRDEIVKTMTKRYMSRYELCLMFPNSEDYKIDLEETERWFHGDAFGALSSGISGDGLIRMMRNKVERKVKESAFR